jgi:murein DD-endopeptidase MepM/ murein hydrolase activator NlpD
VQLSLGAAAVALLGWMTVATSIVVLDAVSGGDRATQVTVLQDAYRQRLEELASERDQRAAEARSAQERFKLAMEQIGRQQTSILDSVEERRELATALELMRARLQDAVEERREIASARDELLAQMTEVSETLDRKQSTAGDLSQTLDTVTGALSEAVVARDTAEDERESLATQVAELELRISMNTRRQEEMLDQLEQAVALSFGPLEAMFEKTDLDVDSLLASVRRSYSGQGGPELPASVSTRSYNDPNLSSRLDNVMVSLDRMNLLRIAAGRVPYSMPITSSFRFTSGFGNRHDPKGRGRRMHEGVDLASSRGTPIFATADGVVISSKRESGYGNVVRVRHDFGFETVYAHLSKLRVASGQKLSRGDRIGDMGSTGRSTGVHLHYEVHLNGRPVNPMPYLEAARNVY